MQAKVDTVSFPLWIPVEADGHALENIHEKLGGVVEENECAQRDQSSLEPYLREDAVVEKQNREFDQQDVDFVKTLRRYCRLGWYISIVCPSREDSVLRPYYDEAKGICHEDDMSTHSIKGGNVEGDHICRGTGLIFVSASPLQSSKAVK